MYSLKVVRTYLHVSLRYLPWNSPLLRTSSFSQSSPNIRLRWLCNLPIMLQLLGAWFRGITSHLQWRKLFNGNLRRSGVRFPMLPNFCLFCIFEFALLPVDPALRTRWELDWAGARLARLRKACSYGNDILTAVRCAWLLLPKAPKYRPIHII